MDNKLNILYDQIRERKISDEDALKKLKNIRFSRWALRQQSGH